jgi:Domain of unknown function (DUF4388)
VSLIGQLEQLNLSLILQGIEKYAKTGLLIVKQDVQKVELYFREGRLMCIGPVRPDMSLGDRLLQAGVISSSALQDSLLAVGVAEPGETRLALTLMELGHVSHEGLRAWATNEASGVIQILLTWQNGEIYFEDEIQPPADRLLVSFSASSLLPAPPPVATPANPTRHETGAIRLQNIQPWNESTVSVQAQPAGLLSAAQLITEMPPISASFSSPLPSLSATNMFSDVNVQVIPQLSPPMRISQPLPPLRIDTSFMRPDMVLKPLDLSALRQQSPQLQITPGQWRILTRVDGRTTLQTACQELGISAELLCQVAGELIALGLIHVSMPTQQASMNELPPVSADLFSPASNNGYVSYGNVVNTPQPWVAVTHTTDALPPSFGAHVSYETMSQWGNGGTGATFVPGRGWVANPQPMQPLQPGSPFYTTGGVYAPVGSGR